jgi:hypothetical protein
MTSTKGLVGAALVGLLLSAPARAEGPRPVAPAAERKVDKERLREQIMDKLRAERMWKLTEALKLDEVTAARLFPLLAKFDDTERAIAKERGPLARELRDTLDAPTPDGNRVSGLVDRLIEIRKRRQALEIEKLSAVRKVLSPTQMGKLLLLAPKIDEGFRDRIRQAVQAARQSGELSRGKGHAAPDDAVDPY